MSVDHQSRFASPTVVFDTDYSKLPASPPVDMVFVLDPLIATGGTAAAALNMITEWGIPGMDSLPGRSDRSETLRIFSTQDQVALHLGVGAGTQVCVKSVPGHRSRRHILQSGAFSHLEVDMGRCC